MNRHQLLRALHTVLQPRTYFEIGVRKGRSLALAKRLALGVDPSYSVTEELRCDVHLVRTTSDEFFAREHPFAHFDGRPVDLAFIDGMHLAEYALRDFINTERFCGPGTVVVFDDVLPRNVAEAARRRLGSAKRGAWTGDVFKVVDALRSLRPDLITLEVDTQPTGTLVALLPNPDDRVLERAYDDLVEQYVTPDPQVVPAWALNRERALSGEELVGSSVWPQVRSLRELPDSEARPRIEGAYRAAGLVTRGDS